MNADPRHHPRRCGRGARHRPSSPSARPTTCAGGTPPTRTIGGDRFVRDAGHGQHPHPHHRRAADPWLRPRRHAVRRERVRVAVPAVLGVRRRRGAHLGSAGRGRDAALGHHHVPRGRHDPLPRRGHRRAGRGRHPRPRGPLGVGPAARAVGVPPEHRRRHRPPRAPAARASLARRRSHRRVEHPRRPHHVQRSAVAAAKALADEHGVGLSFHMSPAQLDPDGFIAEFGQRPDGAPRRDRRARRATWR